MFDLSSVETRARVFAGLDLGDVWGLGRASIDKLARLGVTSVGHFTALKSDQVRELLTVTGQRTHAELLGIPCFAFTTAPPPKKSLAVTRSFGQAVTSWEGMREAAAAYATRAAEKLRRHGLQARALWRDGYGYAKAGIVLLDLYQPDEQPVADLFPSRDPAKSAALMAALDSVNQRFGRNTLRPGAVAAAPAWGMRRNNLSPCYTTRETD